MSKVIVVYYYQYDFKANIDIELLGCRIKTYNKSLLENYPVEEPKNTFLKIFIITPELEEYESLVDTLPMVRPNLITILGVLSFVTKYPFTTFDSFGNEQVVREDLPLPISEKEKFIFNDRNYLPQIIQLRKNINSTNEQLLSSLLDRWRKAYYLERDSKDNFIMFDEALLSYFHIFELLSNEYYKSQKVDAEQKIEKFIDDFINTIYYSNDLLGEKQKLVNEIMLSYLPVKSKILYMLNKQGLLTNRVEYYISDLIKIRNKVAHGRQAYQDKIIFPVPVFFPIIKNNIDFSQLRCFTARIIALHFNSDLYSEEWKVYSDELPPTKKEVSDFLSDKIYINLTNQELINGNADDISPLNISEYVLNDDIKLKKALECFEHFISSINPEDEIGESAVWVAVIIVDYSKKVKEVCKNIIIHSYENNLVPHWSGKFKDLVYFLEAKNISCKTLRELLKSKQIR